jgi:hypothetical protein
MANDDRLLLLVPDPNIGINFRVPDPNIGIFTISV